MRSKQQQGGFTLIELVVVIIILGILAAVALPKFMGLSNQARIAVVNGTAGSVTEAADMVHALAEIHGQTASTGSVTLPDGSTVTTAYGYPDSTSTGILAALQEATSQASTAFPFTFSASTPTATFTYTAPGGTPMQQCLATYVEPTASTPAPRVSTTIGGC